MSSDESQSWNIKGCGAINAHDRCKRLVSEAKKKAEKKQPIVFNFRAPLNVFVRLARFRLPLTQYWKQNVYK